MDAPLSVPRMFVAALFALAALTPLAGAVRHAERRPWWAAVGVVSLLIAEVKAAGTVHVRLIEATGLGGRPLLALVVSAAVAVVVLAALWWLSRTERRDRHRMLIALGLYATAAVVFPASRRSSARPELRLRPARRRACRACPAGRQMR